MKQYYLLINTTTSTNEYWAGDNKNVDFLLKTNNLIIPLGSKKPKNVSRETLKQF